MAQYQTPLDGIFQALADPTRRAVVGRLGRGPASVGELAQPFAMALPSFMKHIHMLEESGLIRTSKLGRVRHCELDRPRLAAVDGWLNEQKAIWDGRTDRLDKFVTEEKDKKK
jgi:DNA-binding transcriptional ArsR family regulator